MTRYCSTCKYFAMDTAKRFPVYTCQLWEDLIKRDEQATTCDDYVPLANGIVTSIERVR